VIYVGSETGTLTCPPPPVVGCGQRFDIFSITSDLAGQYVAEFRLGHPWNHAEYYQTVFLNVQVVDASATYMPPPTIGQLPLPLDSMYLAIALGVAVLAAFLLWQLHSSKRSKPNH
jgi:hypothetical protein